ncbi:hypothetical protein M413DRAFT_22079 [Hebeloma cylindrosporum]|uniref:Uncharacterized protein n=1 Tax=Hebeloma cylindrosporum TaxID=76867 RepID=A0A0C3CF85_HEBCY|nr:hypothetical protein M413DRAFT_22079 [Hebeloma cylindrosporum h7]
MTILRPDRCVVWDGQQACGPCTEDTELEKQAKELEIRLEKIYTRRRALRTGMNENHDPFIHKFPPEIASHIFIHYAPPSLLFDENRRSTPLDIGAVCQKWRQLAWATPQLWSSLFVRTGLRARNNRSSDSDMPQLISEWLERSASVPLTIAFHHMHMGHVNGDNVSHKVINILNKHSAKWYDVHFDLTPSLLLSLHGSSDSLGKNILNRLVLCSPELSYLDDGRVPTTFSMNSKPSPTDLTLIRVGVRDVDIIWVNLTVATVEQIGVDECFELMAQAPLLEKLSLCKIYPSSSRVPFPKTRIVCPRLHSLQLLKITEETVVAGILDSLCLPSLEKWIHYRCALPMDDAT